MTDKTSDLVDRDARRFTIKNNDEPIVVIKANGDIEVNPKYEVSEAARLFWNEVRKQQRRAP